jgi:iron complex outermembrane recepter protein
LEAETRWYVSDNWTLSTGIGLLDTKLYATGRELSNSPSYTYSASVSYSGNNGVFGSLELTGRDEYFESNSTGNNQQRDTYSLVNTAIGYKYEDWTFSLWARNFLNEDYQKRLFYFGNAQPDWIPTRYEDPADPRQIGVTARYSF